MTSNVVDMRPPPIGSSAWKANLAQYDVSADLAEGLARAAAAMAGESLPDCDPYDLDSALYAIARTMKACAEQEVFDLREEAFDGLRREHREVLEQVCEFYSENNRETYEWLELTVWILFHEVQPGYAALVQGRLLFISLDVEHPMRKWHTRQVASMILHGSEAVRESVEYYLFVDPFEVPREARVVFPTLRKLLPVEHYDVLLRASEALEWELKRDFYYFAAEYPELHDALAEGLIGSIYGVYGKVDRKEAGLLAGRIDISDPERRRVLDEGLAR
ncbi:MAG: hypothetical protein ACOCV2_13885 [Persicimonas sp.]